MFTYSTAEAPQRGFGKIGFFIVLHKIDKAVVGRRGK
jgi:hypothetical protein